MILDYCCHSGCGDCSFRRAIVPFVRSCNCCCCCCCCCCCWCHHDGARMVCCFVVVKEDTAMTMMERMMKKRRTETDQNHPIQSMLQLLVVAFVMSSRTNHPVVDPRLRPHCRLVVAESFFLGCRRAPELYSELQPCYDTRVAGFWEEPVTIPKFWRKT